MDTSQIFKATSNVNSCLCATAQSDSGIVDVYIKPLIGYTQELIWNKFITLIGFDTIHNIKIYYGKDIKINLNGNTRTFNGISSITEEIKHSVVALRTNTLLCARDYGFDIYSDYAPNMLKEVESLMLLDFLLKQGDRNRGGILLSKPTPEDKIYTNFAFIDNESLLWSKTNLFEYSTEFTSMFTHPYLRANHSIYANLVLEYANIDNRKDILLNFVRIVTKLKNITFKDFEFLYDDPWVDTRFLTKFKEEIFDSNRINHIVNTYDIEHKKYIR